MQLTKNQARMQNKQYGLDQKRFWLEIVKTVGLVVTLLTAYLAYNKYLDDKERDRNAAYRGALYQLLSSDVRENKIGLNEIVRFDERYPESVPILVDVLMTMDDGRYVELKNYFSISAMSIGPPFFSSLAEHLHLRTVGIDSLETQRQRAQWLVVEFMKANKNLQNRMEMDQITLVNADVSNKTITGLHFSSSTFEGVAFDNCLLSSCDFSNSVFRRCSFWKAEFSKSVNLDSVRFEDCNFLQGTILSSVETTIFNSCDVSDLSITGFQEGNFQGCRGIDRIKRTGK